MSSLSRSAVLGAQEEHHQEKGHPRPVGPQQVHSMPHFLDDHGGGCASSLANRSLLNIDRSQGCLLVHSCPSLFRKYLGFCLGQQNFQFMTLPFGLNLAPRVFTKLCRPILRELRSRGVKVLVYLEDWLMWGNSPEECAQFTDMVLVTLANAVS